VLKAQKEFLARFQTLHWALPIPGGVRKAVEEMLQGFMKVTIFIV